MKLKTVAIAVSILALSIGILGYAQTASAPFDRAIWLQGENAKMSPDAPRLSMADGLVSSRALLGKSRSEVEAMLGMPTQTNLEIMILSIGSELSEAI
jgi:hypothetical protein